MGNCASGPADVAAKSPVSKGRVTELTVDTRVREEKVRGQAAPVAAPRPPALCLHRAATAQRPSAACLRRTAA